MSVALNREEKLLEKIFKLMARSSFNDLRIKLKNGVQLDANKVILAAMSPFVDQKLNEKITSDQFLEIEIDIMCSKEILELVIKFFYTGKMNFDSLVLRELLDILYLLRLFEVEEFTEIEKFTSRQIEEGEFILAELLKLSSVAEAYNLDAIVSSMISCLKQNISDVSELPEVSYISSKFLEDLINLNDEVNQDDGELHSTKFEIVTSWLRSNTISDELKIKLHSIFDLRKFTNQQLTSTVRDSKLFSDSSILDALSNLILDLEKNLEEKTKSFNIDLDWKNFVIGDRDRTIKSLERELETLKNEAESKTKSFDLELNWKNFVIANREEKIQNLKESINEKTEETKILEKLSRIQLSRKSRRCGYGQW